MAETRTIPLAQVQALRAKVEDYRATSQQEAEHDRALKWHTTAHGRACEEAALAVVVIELDALIASASAQAEPPCDGDCNPYIASCGAGFCSFEDMAAHNAKHQAYPPPAPASERPETERL
jgi:hypothetical protein